MKFPKIARVFRPPIPKDAGQDYRIFTRTFDRTVTAAELEAVVGSAGLNMQDALSEIWADYAKPINDQTARSRVGESLAEAQRADIVVTLLVDQSGSLRDEPIRNLAPALDAAQLFLRSLEVKTEILGFTTVTWHGGEPRKIWLDSGRPYRPGRLAELLHVVYRDADDPSQASCAAALRQMLRRNLLKENIDGEALLWAAGRLARRTEGRRLLVVVSDGAPVDDATLQANGPTYLEDHLKLVIAHLNATGQVELSAFGVGFDVSRYYAVSRGVTALTRLGPELIDFLAERLTA